MQVALKRQAHQEKVALGLDKEANNPLANQPVLLQQPSTGSLRLRVTSSFNDNAAETDSIS